MNRTNRRRNRAFSQLFYESRVSESRSQNSLLQQIRLQRQQGIEINDIGLLFQLYVDLRVNHHSQNNSQHFSNLFQLFQVLQHVPDTRGLTRQEIRKLKITKANSNQKDCPVCQEVMKKDQQILILSCNHPFHYQCIVEWLIKSNKCPLCRKQVRV